MKSVDTLPKTTFSGRRFTRKQLAEVQETVQTFSKLSRRELAQTVCEHLQWKNAKGANKVESGLKLLDALEAHGVVTLSEKRSVRTSSRRAVESELAVVGAPVNDTLEAISPIVLERVVTAEQRASFKAYVQTHHYLGYSQPVAGHICYFIVSQPRQQRLGCLLFSASAAWHLAPRDRFIGWEKKQRVKLLHLILSQDRFLIFPWVAVPNLATRVLAMASKQVADDWLAVHGYRPVLIETFVDPTRFSGTCYRAANWHCVGQTQGRGRFDPKHQYPETVKTIFVQPLQKNWRRCLTEGHQARPLKQRYRNDLKSSRKHRVDDAFIGLWKKVLHLLHDIAAEYDKKWRVRKRTIDTLLLILLIFRLITSKNKQGYGTTIDELWDSCQQLELPLPQKASIAPSSLCEARQKLDEDVFKSLNRRILLTYANHNADDYRWLGHRLFAVDGSKVHLPRRLRQYGYPLPSQHAHYPQGLLSCLYQLKSQLPFDFDLVLHGNERLCAEQHLCSLSPGDVVVYDRGYFSYVMLHHHCEAGIYAVFRLPENSCSAVKEFWESSQTDTVVTLYPLQSTLEKIKSANPEIKLVPRRMRLMKYNAGDNTFCLGTTLVEPKHLTYPLQAFKDLYFSRWGIEELYKISKHLFLIQDFHSKSERGVKQELFAHFVLITMNRLFANDADREINPPEDADDPWSLEPTKPALTSSRLHRIKTNFKNCLHVISRHLEPLLFLHTQLSRAVDIAYKSIVKRHQRVRPGRSYQRKSKSPRSKWQSSFKTKKKKTKSTKKSTKECLPDLATTFG